MAKKTKPPKGPDPRWFSVVVWVHAPHLTMEVQLLEFPVPAQTRAEALSVVRNALMSLFFNSKTETWTMGGQEVYPWSIIAVPYPMFLSDMLTAELLDDVSSGTGDVVRGKILQLFPSQPPVKSEDPPEDGP
jgi:hypothetical protein